MSSSVRVPAVILCFDAGGGEGTFLAAAGCFCPGPHQMLSKGRCGTMLGRCWRLSLSNCVVQGRRCFSKAQVFAWAAPSQYTVLGSQEGSVALLSFYLQEQDTSSCPSTASAPRTAGSDFLHIFSHPPSPFHLLTAGVKGKETKKELSGLW